jgi:hypothetical protein
LSSNPVLKIFAFLDSLVLFEFKQNDGQEVYNVNDYRKNFELRSVINEVTKLVVELVRNSLSKQLLEGM